MPFPFDVSGYGAEGEQNFLATALHCESCPADKEPASSATKAKDGNSRRRFKPQTSTKSSCFMCPICPAERLGKTALCTTVGLVALPRHFWSSPACV